MLADERWSNPVLQIFAKGHSTLGQSPFTRPARLGEPLTFPVSPAEGTNDSVDPSFPSMTVEPTDLLLADVDGVVVVPRSLVIQVVELAKKGREVDERCMKDLREGKGVTETFKKHRG
jgi:hypothetical protein